MDNSSQFFQPSPTPAESDGQGRLKNAQDALNSLPSMLSADELAEWLKISKRTIWRLKSAGAIPQPVKIGRSVRWQRTDVAAWLEKGCPVVSSPLNTLLYNLILRPIYFIWRT
jgi:excisionase family DNA binding protein